MARIRPELVKGIAVLGMFLIVIVSVQLLYPYHISDSGYTTVNLEVIKMSPPPVDELNVSSSAVIDSLVIMSGDSFILTIEEVTLQIPTDALYALDQLPASGDLIYFRGTMTNFSAPHVFVHEFNMLDYNSSLIRSIPGIILFIVLFFYVFTIDFRHLAFLPRRSEGA